jgi:hypothetical protein
MSVTVTLQQSRPSAIPPNRAQGYSRRREKKDDSLVGSWVKIERGVAARTCGYVYDCQNGRATLLATVLAGRSVLLTVAASDCTPLDAYSR